MPRHSLFARLSERNVGVGAKPHIPALAIKLKPEHPGSGAGGRDAKI